MTIIVQQSAVTSPSSDSTTTVQNVIDAVDRDLRKQLNATAASAAETLLIDYTNRISLSILRFSRWRFLLSPPKRFITELHQTAYWVGDTCACCGETKREFLTLDHINGGGTRDRQKSGGLGVLRRLAKEGWPKESYQILCINCNHAKRFGICPHQMIG